MEWSASEWNRPKAKWPQKSVLGCGVGSGTTRVHIRKQKSRADLREPEVMLAFAELRWFMVLCDDVQKLL